MKKLLIKLISDTRGQGFIEYGLIISLVILVAIGALELFGFKVGDLFEYIGEAASGAL